VQFMAALHVQLHCHLDMPKAAIRKALHALLVLPVTINTGPSHLCQ
jgi:hypothetical protein